MKGKFRFFTLFIALIAAVSVAAVTQSDSVPDVLLVAQGESASMCAREYIQINPVRGSAVRTAAGGTNGYDARASLLGILPLKTVECRTVERKTVALMGTPVGVKLYTDGVIVSGTTEVITKDGRINPGEKAGLAQGDMIVAADGRELTCAQDLMDAILNSNGALLRLTVRRDNGDTRIVGLQPALSSVDGCYRAGIWVRDSSAGIGILTYVEPGTMAFGGLGHAICDSESDVILPVANGELTDVVLTDLVPGASGAPGELVGYLGERRLGILDGNNECGIFGRYAGTIEGAQLYPAAVKQETVEGRAQMLTTLPGESAPRFFDIIIEKINYDSDSPTRNMIVRVNDPALLDKAGGIVQGMSGSPIIQNGRFVGAVTHVFVNDPTKGYAIFAEKMLYQGEMFDNGALNAA